MEAAPPPPGGGCSSHTLSYTRTFNGSRRREAVAAVTEELKGGPCPVVGASLLRSGLSHTPSSVPHTSLSVPRGGDDLCPHVCPSLLEPLGAPAPPGHLHAVPDGPQGVQRRTHVQDGEAVGVPVHVPVVVVDDVAHLRPTAVDHPVVAVEGQLVPEDRKQRG